MAELERLLVVEDPDDDIHDVRAGRARRKKGAGGGYSLNKDPKDIYLVHIMRITDGPIAMVPCASLNFYHKCDECKQETTCGIRDVFVDLHSAALKILSETSISDIIDREKVLIFNN